MASFLLENGRAKKIVSINCHLDFTLCPLYLTRQLRSLVGVLKITKWSGNCEKCVNVSVGLEDDSRKKWASFINFFSLKMGCRINGLSHEGTYIHKANAAQWGQSLYEGALDFLNFERYFLTFPACFQIPIIFSNLNPNCSK